MVARTRASTTKNYSALAKAKIRKPRNRAPSMLIYGRNKKGKTHFCCSAGKVLIVDPEDGTDSFQKANPDVWPVTKWTDLDEVYKFLRFEDHGYDYVALDGMTRFSNMALHHVMKIQEERDITRQPGFVQQRDYGKAGELVKDFMINMHALDVGKIYTAQERQESGGDFTEEDEDVESSEVRFVPDMPKGVRGVVNGMVDVIGRIYTVRVDVTDSEGNDKRVTRRRLWLAPAAIYDTGFRSDFRLPDYLPNPSLPRLVQLIKEGKVTSNGTRKG